MASTSGTGKDCPKQHPTAMPDKLLSNHSLPNFNPNNEVFHHNNVLVKSEKNIVGLGQKTIDRLYETYMAEHDGKKFEYDGERSLFSVGPLRKNKVNITVVLEESPKRIADENDWERSKQPKPINVEMSLGSKIPTWSVNVEAVQGWTTEYTINALRQRVLNIFLRQQQANRGCPRVVPPLLENNARELCDLAGSSYSSSQRPNDDVTATMIMTPGPVLDFLLSNQNVTEMDQIDWAKAKRMLKNLRIKTTYNKRDFKITGLSELSCKEQRFPIIAQDSSRTVDITVYDYFTEKGIQLTWSASLPCLDVGRRGRSTYLPIEVCVLVPLQKYPNASSSQHRTSLVENQKHTYNPIEECELISLQRYTKNEDPMVGSCSSYINKSVTEVDGHVLAPPKLRFGNNEDTPRNGSWNFDNKRVLDGKDIMLWAIVNFSAACDMDKLSRELINCGKNIGIKICEPHALIEEDQQWNRSDPETRVDKMFVQLMESFEEFPKFLLCILPKKKPCDIYGPWKKKNLHEVGIVTQCIYPTKVNNRYLTNVLLKINCKLGGVNSLLTVELSRRIPIIHEIPTLILGMDVWHGSPGPADHIPSVTAVVGSRCWPNISSYKASVRTQTPKMEMIQDLFKPRPNGNGDDGIMRELLMEFFATSQGRKPGQVIIFRDGVSDSQFSQVLNIELNQIRKAFYFLGETTLPKFTVIIAKKNHSTRLSQRNCPDNVQPGTVVHTRNVDPRYYDFYMCAHRGKDGISRPVHYHVILDEIGFSPDDLQNLVHTLTHAYQRSTDTISIVAPIMYAHLAAAQVSQFMKLEDFSVTSSAIPQLPPLHKNVCSSMFFC